MFYFKMYINFDILRLILIIIKVNKYLILNTCIDNSYFYNQIKYSSFYNYWIIMQSIKLSKSIKYNNFTYVFDGWDIKFVKLNFNVFNQVMKLILRIELFHKNQYIRDISIYMVYLWRINSKN